MKTTVTLLILLTVVSLNTFAQDSPQWHLPDGATARLGKGSISEIAYSPDGTRLAVASSIGIWLYDTATYQEVALLTGHTSSVSSVAFSPDGRTLASGSWLGSVSGMRSQGRTNAPSPGIRMGSLAWRSVRMVAPSHRGVGI